MRQCTSVTDRRTDGLASWHKRELYVLHLALKTSVTVQTLGFRLGIELYMFRVRAKVVLKQMVGETILLSSAL